MPAFLIAAAANAVLIVGLCLNSEAPACPEGADHFVEYQLFMGRSNASGEIVDDAAWAEFLKDTVIPRFPDGLTVLNGQGHWRGSQGIAYQERSKMLVVLAPPGDGPMGLTAEISDEYKRQVQVRSPFSDVVRGYLRILFLTQRNLPLAATKVIHGKTN